MIHAMRFFTLALRFEIDGSPAPSPSLIGFQSVTGLLEKSRQLNGQRVHLRSEKHRVLKKPFAIASLNFCRFSLMAQKREASEN